MSEIELKKFTFYWMTGDREVHEGTDPADALTRAGYGGGAIRALDFYSKGDDHNFEWRDKSWHSIKPTDLETTP